MEVKSFRAASIQDALQLIRDELGPDASLLQARAVEESAVGSCSAGGFGPTGES